jgi:hypothetical protein
MPAPVAPADCNNAKAEPWAIIPPNPAYTPAAIEPAATPPAVNPIALIAEALIALIRIGAAPAATPAMLALKILSFSSSDKSSDSFDYESLWTCFKSSSS